MDSQWGLGHRPLRFRGNGSTGHSAPISAMNPSMMMSCPSSIVTAIDCRLSMSFLALVLAMFDLYRPLHISTYLYLLRPKYLYLRAARYQPNHKNTVKTGLVIKLSLAPFLPTSIHPRSCLIAPLSLSLSLCLSLSLSHSLILFHPF